MNRTAIRLLDAGLDFRDVVQLAQLAEKKGFEAIFFNGGGFMQLAALGPVTGSIKLVTGVATIYTSTPAQLFQQAALLDRIFNGRAVLGLGTGHPEAAIASGQSYDKPLGRMREYVTAIRQMLRKGSAPTNPGLTTRSPTRADMQIWNAAMQLGMCQVAGEVGDGVLLNWLTPAYAADAVASIRSGAEKAAKDPASVEIASYIRVSTATPDEGAYKAMALDIAGYVSRTIYRRHFDALGRGQETRKITEAYAESPERGAALVTDAMLEDFAAMGREASEQRIQLYRDLGISLPVLAPIASRDVDDWKAIIDLA